MLKLTRLMNAEGEVVGYFSDHVAERIARSEWNEHYSRSFDYATQTLGCRSVDTYIKSIELGDVEPGEGDRVVYCLDTRESEMRSEGGKTFESALRGAQNVCLRSTVRS